MKEFADFDSKKISWFRCGGKIAIYCIVDNLRELKSVLNKYKKYNDNTIIIGSGSNLLIRDKGFNGLAIKLSGDFNKMKIINKNKKTFLVAGAGVLDSFVAVFAFRNNLIGGEFLSTIPGTIGGAVAMNAGCFGSEIKDVLYSVRVFINGKIKNLQKKHCCFSYRKSVLPKNAIILGATFLLKKGTKKQMENSKRLISDMALKRKENQVMAATCGSTFKNPEGTKLSAWELIDGVGLRGYCVGGAKFSEKHCNFLINYNNSSASDIEKLISLAKDKVKSKFNINLEEEIKIFGDI